ncbi:MAG: hypothetical protein RLY79_772 [Actinomycetota bacterium]|jgi:uncharacterized protein (DUF305 family)
MKNNRLTIALLSVIAVLLAGILGVVILKENGSMDMDMGHDMGSHMSGSSNSSDTGFTGADTMFLQMMIPHHQQAVDISEVALKVSKNAELLALAKIIMRDQKSEILQMKSWLQLAGSSEDMGHSMKNMGGMLGEEELKALNEATGKEFDVLWLKGMIGHHDGAIHMSEMIRDANNPEIKAFGEKIVKDQSAQIAQMKKMLA